ncbi:MAG: hypothetical protein K2Z25_06400 [Beijerinckiaceae bacterium]|jgi:hypothetical protein|nr:hypothetical protein [Beijerinckiaceae bacterium]
MKRLVILAGLFAVSVALAGCDKCGDPVKFFSAGPDKACGDTRPAG